MNSGWLIALLLVVPGWSVARAQSGADEQYVMIYGMFGQADALVEGGQPRQARAEYQAALAELQKFARVYPDWSPNIITFRENYLADKIASTTALLPAERPALVPGPPNTPPVVPDRTLPVATAPVTTPAPPDAALTARLQDLQTQVDNLQAGNAQLTAKLREALTVQPTAMDPRTLAAAQEQVRSLMKENDLLRVSLDRPHSGAEGRSLLVASNELAQARQSLAEMGKQLSRAMAQAGKLSAENQALEAQTKTLMESHDGLEALREENTFLKKQLAESQAEAKAGAEAAAATARKMQAQLAQAQAQVAVLQAAARQSEGERAALEAKVKELEAAAVIRATVVPPPPLAELAAPVLVTHQPEVSYRTGVSAAPVLVPLNELPLPPIIPSPLPVAPRTKVLVAPTPENVPSGVAEPPAVVTIKMTNATMPTTAMEMAVVLAQDAVRIQALEQERDVLRVKLMAATQLWGGDLNRAATNSMVVELKQQLQVLQARLAVDESHPVPKP